MSRVHEFACSSPPPRVGRAWMMKRYRWKGNPPNIARVVCTMARKVASMRLRSTLLGPWSATSKRVPPARKACSSWTPISTGESTNSS